MERTEDTTMGDTASAARKDSPSKEDLKKKRNDEAKENFCRVLKLAGFRQRRSQKDQTEFISEHWEWRGENSTTTSSSRMFDGTEIRKIIKDMKAGNTTSTTITPTDPTLLTGEVMRCNGTFASCSLFVHGDTDNRGIFRPHLQPDVNAGSTTPEKMQNSIITYLRDNSIESVHNQEPHIFFYKVAARKEEHRNTPSVGFTDYIDRPCRVSRNTTAQQENKSYQGGTVRFAQREIGCFFCEVDDALVYWDFITSVSYQSLP